MKRRTFVKKAGLAAGSIIAAPYILPSGRLFAATGNRLADHVVFVLFAGGIRAQESVEKQYLAGQGLATEGNLMENMLTGARPTSNLLYDPWDPILSQSLAAQGTLFQELRYEDGPTGHYNGHTVAMTGHYSSTGLNIGVNPENPTIFEYYRKHSSPENSAINCWWISDALGPYPSLNYSQHPSYGPMYGANFLQPAAAFGDFGYQFLSPSQTYQLDDVDRIQTVKNFLDKSFAQNAGALPGVHNGRESREAIKQFVKNVQAKFENGNIDISLPPGIDFDQITGDLINISLAWQVLDQFKPELTVINTTNSDVCHTNFSGYVSNLHKADYGVGWLWNKIQQDPVMANNTIMICMPEHGRNAEGNNVFDSNGMIAYDHTSDLNSRRIFALISGPDGVVKQNQILGNPSNPQGASIDIIPTIAHILGFHQDIPNGMLPGKIMENAFS